MTQLASDTFTTATVADAQMRLIVDSAVDAIDGLAGGIDEMLVDPRSRQVTDVMVRGRHEDPRVVPLDVVTNCDERLTLSWSLADIDDAQPVVHIALVASEPRPVEDEPVTGTIAIGRSSEVIGVDGHLVGHVRGLVVELEGAITHVVVGRGHLWARRDVEVLVGHVDSFLPDRVQLGIGRDIVDTFPSTRPRRHERSRPT